MPVATGDRNKSYYECLANIYFENCLLLDLKQIELISRNTINRNYQYRHMFADISHMSLDIHCRMVKRI